MKGLLSQKTTTSIAWERTHDHRTGSVGIWPRSRGFWGFPCSRSSASTHAMFWPFSTCRVKTLKTWNSQNFQSHVSQTWHDRSIYRPGATARPGAIGWQGLTPWCEERKIRMLPMLILILAMFIQFCTVCLNSICWLCCINLSYPVVRSTFCMASNKTNWSTNLSKHNKPTDFQKTRPFQKQQKHARETTGCGSKSCQPRLSCQVWVWNKWFSKLSTIARLLGTLWLLTQVEVIQ